MFLFVATTPRSTEPATCWHGSTVDGPSSEQFWMYLNLDMVAPQTFARTFTKPGFRLY